MPKQTKYVFIIAVITPLFLSCNHSKKKKSIHSDKGTVRISVDLDTISPGIGPVVRQARVFPLQLDKKALIKRINKIIINKDHLFLFDQFAKQVLVYDTLGHHDATIKRIGKGPGEYLFPTDMIYDKKTHLIGLTRQETGELLWYNKKGQFQGSDHIDRRKFVLSVVFLHNNKIYHFNASPYFGHYKVHITDVHLKKIYRSLFKKHRDQTDEGGTYFLFGLFKHKVTFRLPYGQCLYAINSDTIPKVFEVHFKGKNMPQSLVEKLVSKKYNRTETQINKINQEMAPYALVEKIIPLRNRIFIAFDYHYQPMGLVVNLDNSKVHVFKSYFAEISLKRLVGYNRTTNTLYFAISPMNLKRILQDSSLIKSFQFVRENLMKIKNVYSFRKKLKVKDKNAYDFNPWILKLKLK